MDSAFIWQAIREGGFTALAAILIWYVLKTTGDREKSFREREAKFIELMQCYSQQLEHIAQLLTANNGRIEDLTTTQREVKDTVSRWIERRIRESDKQ